MKLNLLILEFSKFIVHQKDLELFKIKDKLHIFDSFIQAFNHFQFPGR